jgi:hypothetical protein
MTDYMNRLAQGSGAVNNPAPAASLGFQQQQANQQGAMQGLGGIMQGAQGVYNSYSNYNASQNNPNYSNEGYGQYNTPDPYAGATQDTGGGWFVGGAGSGPG